MYGEIIHEIFGKHYFTDSVTYFCYLLPQCRCCVCWLCWSHLGVPLNWWTWW